MAIAIRTEFRAGPGTEMYDGVGAAMGIDTDPPAGLIFHWAGNVDGKWTVNDVWESRAAYERFVEERLIPAIKQVAGAEPEGGVTTSDFAVHNYVRP